MAPKQGNLTLPKSILERIGGEDVLHGGRKSRPRSESRKDSRKAARTQKKSLRHGPPPQKRFKRTDRYESDLDDHDSALETLPLEQSNDTLPQLKPILKPTKKVVTPRTSSASRLSSPPISIPRSVKNKLAEDDEEIAALEKKLGLKGKRLLPRSFKDDGLSDLLEGLDGGEADPEDYSERVMKTDGDAWLKQKRKQAREVARKNMQETESEEVSDNESIQPSDGGDTNMTSDMPSDDSDTFDEASDHDLTVGEELLDNDKDFAGFDSEQDRIEDLEPAKPRLRENPYVAPNSGNGPSAKYVPPSLRKQTGSDTEVLTRLRRQIQGLVNRLTEANLISILGEIEQVYRDNPRQHVTSTLVDILLISVCEPTSLPDTLIILPAGFITAVYKIIGVDFGAQTIQRVTELFDEHYSRENATERGGPAAATSNTSKETLNLIMLLSELYNFQLVGSTLVFDYIRLFLQKLSELNVELLLKVIRTSGPQLRQDDPTSLRDIVTMLRPAIASVGGEGNVSVRTKFMIETINDLKNNKMKTGGQASAITSEHIIRMKKILGSLNNRSIKGGEPLRISLQDIRDLDKKGKWWLVGASWAGNGTNDTNDDTKSGNSSPVVHEAADTGSSDLFQLAREHRMNTDIRRAIFVAIMSAEDYEDAYQRLLKLKLKKVQEYEIPKVLIHCSSAEQTYNPYYTLIARRVCGDRKLKTAFQYCLWDLFRRMGESEEDARAENDNESLDTRHIVNLGKMFGTLIVEGGLSLGVLKNLNMSYLQTKTKEFAEVMFVTILLRSQKDSEQKRDEKAVAAVFRKVQDNPQMIMGLQYFIKKIVSKTDLAGGTEHTATVKWACKLAIKTLEDLAAIDTTKV